MAGVYGNARLSQARRGNGALNEAAGGSGRRSRLVRYMEPAIDVAMDVQVAVRLATPASRGLALAIDLILLQILQVALWLIGIPLAALLGTLGGFSDPGWLFALVILAVTVVSAGIFMAFELFWDGQTPGKRLLGIRVVTEEGQAAGAGAIVLRNVMRLVDFLPGAFVGGLLAMALSPKNQRLGDMVAGTLVVAVERKPTAMRAWPQGLADRDVKLLEAWFDRAPKLSPERGDELAQQLLVRLGWEMDRAFPGRAKTATATLYLRCPEAS